MGKGTASKRVGEFGLAGKPSGSPAWVLAKVEVSGRGGKPETRVVMPMQWSLSLARFVHLPQQTWILTCFPALLAQLMSPPRGSLGLPGSY